MAHKLAFGMVGSGRTAPSYAQAFEDCEAAQLMAVADIRPEAIRAMAEGFGDPWSHRPPAHQPQ